MISLVMALLILVSYVEAHGRFSIPSPRPVSGTGGPNAPTYTCNGPVFGGSKTSIRCHDVTDPGQITTVTAGQELTVEWIFEAAHPGDCSIWISYDTDKSSPANWVKLKNMVGCLAPDGKTPSITSTKVLIPSNMPNCDHCVMRWEWYAVQQVSNVEFYVQCFDVKIVGGNDNCPQPSPTTLISDITYLGNCPFYNPYNGAFDEKRSRGPSEWSAPATCSGGSPPTASAPTSAPPAPTTSALTSAPTAPTAAPTRGPTKDGETFSPTVSPTTSPISSSTQGYPLSGVVAFTGKLRGVVTFKQYSPNGRVGITVSLKNFDSTSTSANSLSITESCTLNAAVLHSVGDGNYNGDIGTKLDGGSTNVQNLIDDNLNVGGTQSIIGKSLTVKRSNQVVDCATILTKLPTSPLSPSAASVQHKIDIIMFTMPLIYFFNLVWFL